MHNRQRVARRSSLGSQTEFEMPNGRNPPRRSASDSRGNDLAQNEHRQDGGVPPSQHYLASRRGGRPRRRRSSLGHAPVALSRNPRLDLVAGTSCHDEKAEKVCILTASQKDSNPLKSRAKRRASLGSPSSPQDSSSTKVETEKTKVRAIPLDDYMRRDSRGKKGALGTSRHGSGASVHSVDFDEKKFCLNKHEPTRVRRRGSLGTKGCLDVSQHSTDSSTRGRSFSSSAQKTKLRSDPVSTSRHDPSDGQMALNSSTHQRFSHRSRSPGRYRQRRRGSLGNSIDPSTHSAAGSSEGEMALNSSTHRRLSHRSRSPGRHRQRRRGSLGNSIDTSSHSAVRSTDRSGSRSRHYQHKTECVSIEDQVVMTANDNISAVPMRLKAPDKWAPRRRNSMVNSTNGTVAAIYAGH